MGLVAHRRESEAPCGFTVLEGRIESSPGEAKRTPALAADHQRRVPEGRSNPAYRGDFRRSGAERSRRICLENFFARARSQMSTNGSSRRERKKIAQGEA